MGQHRFREEVPIMLLVVLVFRVLFCMIEIKLRSFKHSKETSTVDAPSSTPAHSAGGARKKRRTSTAVLYERIAHSHNAPVHMKYASGVWFAWMAIIFVLFAAAIGKGLPPLSSSPTPSPTPFSDNGFVKWVRECEFDVDMQFGSAIVERRSRV
jgi:hypothetical protein